MTDISLVVTDLDGTLWHTDDAVHPDTITALEEVRRRGIPTMVATGRRVTSTREPLARIGWAPPAVMLNGAIGLDLSQGSRFHRCPFSTSAARATLKAFVRAGIDPVVYVELDAFTSPTPGTSPQHVDALGAKLGVADLERVVGDYEILSFGVIGIDYGPGWPGGRRAGRGGHPPPGPLPGLRGRRPHSERPGPVQVGRGNGLVRCGRH